MPKSDRESPRCFFAVPFARLANDRFLERYVRKGAELAGYHVVSPSETPLFPGATIQETTVRELTRSDCIIAHIGDCNPNIFFELGLAQAMGKGILLISHEKELTETPFDLRGFRVITYSTLSKGYSALSRQIYHSLRDFRRFPRRSPALPVLPTSLPFFVDWDSLPPRDAENLCQELLAQMGFRRLNWGKGFPEIDLVAEYPRKDPDGFEFRELWLVSMGMRVPIDMFLDMVPRDPEHFLHSLLRHSEGLDETIASTADASVTLLFVLFRKGRDAKQLEALRERFDERRIGRGLYRFTVRLRMWDQQHLTSLVQRYPHIGYKYFSEEGRIRSKTRKTYEELYEENVRSASKQATLIAQLEDEKNKRIRAERDSIWKDISFSAAHKIGNPIFAIETDLDPLVKRIREDRKAESQEVVENIRASVEKAKAFVEQFKSLAKAQEITKTRCLLRPILEDACQAITNQDIRCIIECPHDTAVDGDPERLGECFVELVMNATHWFDKASKEIDISVVSPARGPLPEFLDSSQEYVLVHVKDNGCGIPVLNKQKVFDAFFTTYDHGTGLGLALVRRIIDGHAGGIVESGVPNEGADFQIYLPLSVPGKGAKEADTERARKKRIVKKKVKRKKVTKQKSRKTKASRARKE